MVGLRAALMVMALGWVASANAASQVTVNIVGTVQAGPPCVINGGKLIEINFGDVQINAIDGRYKTIPIPFTLDCTRAVTNELRLKMQGETGPPPNQYMLAVPGNPNLSIELYKDGSWSFFNTWQNFNSNAQSSYQAVLIKKDPNKPVIAGMFSASAILMVEYR